VWALWLFRAELRHVAAHALACALTIAALLAALVGADRITTWAEDRFYADHVLYSESSPYQRVVVTASRAGVRLFLNGNLQFHSRDEYRYHEALVHPAMAAHGNPKRVLVLGGGDGLAAREVLKHRSVEEVVLVELDPHMTQLFATQPLLRELNGDALRSPKVRIVHADAFGWLDTHDDTFDVIVVDFPDPTNFSIGKLYTSSFYRLVDQHLRASGYAVVQTTSPLIARKSFWTVATTLESVGLAVVPYHAHVPSFGEWGFILAGRRPFRMPTELPPNLRFIDRAGLPALFEFPPDMAAVPAEVNRLSNQVLGADVRTGVGQGAAVRSTRVPFGGRRAAGPVDARRRALLLASAMAPWAGCTAPPSTRWAGGWIGADVEHGHRLRDRGAAGLPEPALQRRAGALVVGAGIAGLAAARGLVRAGVDDVRVFDLEAAAGGNSRGHAIGGIACPLGAHYLPLPASAQPR
jgi:spermidine synthase